jgi:hypothetical protein
MQFDDAAGKDACATSEATSWLHSTENGGDNILDYLAE